MNRIGVTRSRSQHDRLFDEDGTEIVRQTLVVETLLECPAREQSGLWRDGLPARSSAAASKIIRPTP